MQARITPDESTFRELAQQGNLVPVWCEILADLETPVSAFLKLRAAQPKAQAFLLESVEGGESLARYSFLGIDPRAEIITREHDVILRENGEERQFCLTKGRDPLHIVEEVMSRFRYVPDACLPRFAGGMVGFLGYDLVRFFEKLPPSPPDDRDLPDCHLLLTDTLLIFDSVRHSITVLNNAFISEEGDDPIGDAYDAARDKIEQVLEALRQATPRAKTLSAATQAEEPEPQSNMTREQYEAAVARCVEYIHAGDCVQVVPSQRFQVPLSAEPFDVYRALRHVSPAPYMFFLGLDEVTLIGASPELLVREDNRHVITRPLAGTRPRGRTPQEDQQMEADLLGDEKEVSEHIMLVDLHRNDIGRVCEYGSVHVDEMLFIQRFSHVMHIVSDVVGTLREDKTPFDLLRAAFPAGTLSGAPKVRAMQIINEVEPTRRGPYGGVIGYFSFNGNLDTCITLRTLVVKDGTAYVQAGGGVVADSVPANEYQETRNKARAALRAVALAQSDAK